MAEVTQALASEDYAFFTKRLFGYLTQSGEGHAFALESLRLGHLEGKLGARESLSHRIISEAGAGQARAQLPGGAGGVPTVTKGPGE